MCYDKYSGRFWFITVMNEHGQDAPGMSIFRSPREPSNPDILFRQKRHSPAARSHDNSGAGTGYRREHDIP
jgi:hypothetical protein